VAPASSKWYKNELVTWVEEVSGEKVLGCYQCGKCSAGCPMYHAADILPHQILRLLQLGYAEEALTSRMIWMCAACQTCASRCPRGVDLSRIMEALRARSIREGYVRMHANKVPSDRLEELPQQALVSGYRKLS